MGAFDRPREAAHKDLAFGPGTMPPPQCTFALNGKPASLLVCDGRSFVAFSGHAADTDNPGKTADADEGPLPAGTYYIIARQSSGHLGWLWDSLHSFRNGYDVTKWFMLWRDNGDGKVEDSTLIAGVLRGKFRLHPIGPHGLSEGCITVMSVTQFDNLREYLLKSPAAFIPGTGIRFYGTVTVQ